MDSVTFSQKNLFSSSFAYFEEMRKTGELCDLAIEVQNVSLTAHRIVLAAGIPYFRSVFSNLTQTQEDISVGDLDPAVLESIINFAYSGSINITVENVESLLQTSQALLLEEVSDACVEFLSKRLLLSNVLDVFNLANNLNKSNLAENCILFVQENFEEFYRTDGFGNLSGSVIKEIISSDNLNVTNEKIVLESILKWVKYSPLERHAMLTELLLEVRMIYLPIDYLTEQVSSEELIKGSLACRNLIDEVKNYHLRKNDSKQLNTKIKQRKYRIQPGLYAIHEAYGHCIYQYDITYNTWHPLTSWQDPPPKHKDTISSAVAVNGKLYMIFRETIKTFCPKTLELQLLEAKHRGINGAAVVSHGKIIYCFGSYDVDFESTLQRFDTDQSEWLNSELMKTPRCNAAATILGESIYVTGGYNQGTYLNNVEKYNPLTREWTEVAPLLTPRRRHACVSVNEKIYAFGGNTENCQDLQTGEMYDPLTNKWNFVLSMKSERFSLSLVCYMNEIYAIGGMMRKSKETLTVEIYDPMSEKWRWGSTAPETFKHAVSIPMPDN